MPDSIAPPARLATSQPRRLSLRLALVVAALCALAMVMLNELAHQRTAAALREIQTTNAVRAAINTLVRALSEAESSQRGYILTGNRDYLEPHRVAREEVDRVLKQLNTSAPPGMREAEAMLRFKTLLSQKMGEMALIVRMREENRTEVVQFAVTSGAGLEQMHALHTQADALLTQAETLVAAKRAELYRLLNVSRFGLAAGVLAAFLAFLLYVNQTRALHLADERQQQQLEAERDALESQVRERTSRLTELATHLQQAVEDERAHLARELHDELGALLTAAKLDVARMKSKLPHEADELRERLLHLTETLNQGIALKRRIIEDLRPSSLSNLGLIASLEILSREFGDRSGIEIHTALEPVDLDDNRELIVYRFVQEALTNIGKYAQATKVTVTLKNYVYHAEVSVLDNGVGFDPARLPNATHGLVGMRHRIEASGGRLDINSAPGRGTRLTGTIPRQRAKPQAELADAMAAMSLSSAAYKPSVPAPTPTDVAD